MSGIPKRIAIIGGYGNTGSKVAAHLANEGGFKISILGRDGFKAEALAAKIKNDTGAVVRISQVDVRSPESLRHALADIDLVLSATCETAHSPNVARAALDLGCDYMDTHLSSPRKWGELLKLKHQIVERGRCFISDGGAHPGLAAAMVRLAASEIEIETASVFGSFNIDWANLTFGSNAADDFVGELRDMDPSVYVDGCWQSSWRNQRSHNFGAPAKIQNCVAMNLEEMKRLPSLYPALRETGFYVGGFGWLIDMLVMPACMFALYALPHQSARIGRFLLFSLKRWSPDGKWALLDMEATGQRDGRAVQMTVRVSHQDAYELTALAVVGTIVQYRSLPRRVGLWTQAEYVVPEPYFEFLRSRSVRVSIASD
jgi:saccharopine dehydrogenase (NAD+, L-lysine-forming)